MVLFIKEVEKITGLREDSPVEIHEGFGDIMDSFYGHVERRLRGYSTREADFLIKKAKKIKDETSKRDVLSRIEAALKSAREALTNAKDDEEKKRELRLQMSVLGELKAKVNAFNPLKDNEKDSDDDSTSEKESNNKKDDQVDVLDLDAR